MKYLLLILMTVFNTTAQANQESIKSVYCIAQGDFYRLYLNFSKLSIQQPPQKNKKEYEGLVKLFDGRNLEYYNVQEMTISEVKVFSHMIDIYRYHYYDIEKHFSLNLEIERFFDTTKPFKGELEYGYGKSRSAKIPVTCNIKE